MRTETATVILESVVICAGTATAHIELGPDASNPRVFLVITKGSKSARVGMRQDAVDPNKYTLDLRPFRLSTGHELSALVVYSTLHQSAVQELDC